MEDDGSSMGFPIDMNCDQTYDSESFPNDSLNHSYRAFCPKMCFNVVKSSTCIGDGVYYWESVICAAARHSGVFIQDKDAYFNVKNVN